MGKTATAIMFLLLLIGIAAAADFTINTTAGFDAGTKNYTMTITDEYNHTANALELSFPYAKKDANLAAYWRFENNANDETGSNNGVVSGATYTSSGEYGGAYVFDGINDVINRTNLSGFSGQNLTLSVWVNPQSTQTAYAGILDYSHGYAPNANWVIQQDNVSTNAFYFGYYNGTAWQISTSTTLTAGAWQHFLVVKNGTNVKIYVNGNMAVNFTAASATIFYNTSRRFSIGAVSQTASTYYRWFNGTLDEIKAYSRALTAAEITTLYNSGKRYKSGGNWTSATQIMNPLSNIHLNDTTINYSGVNATVNISKIEWRVGGVVNATYATAITDGTSITISEANLTSGTFNNITANFTIRIYFTGDEIGTPTITSISGNYVTAAVTRTWNASANGNWTDPNNWSPVGVPAEGAIVVFNGTSVMNCTVDANTNKTLDLNITSGYTGTITFNNNISVARHAAIAGGAGFAMVGPYGLDFFGLGNVSSNVTLPFMATEAGAIVTPPNNLTITNLNVKANSLFTLSDGKLLNVTNATTLTGNLYCNGANVTLNTTLINGGTTDLGTSNTTMGNFTMTAGTIATTSYKLVIDGDFNQTGGTISQTFGFRGFQLKGANIYKTGGTLSSYLVEFARNGTTDMRTALSTAAYIYVYKGTTVNTNDYALTTSRSLGMALYTVTGGSGLAVLNCGNSTLSFGDGYSVAFYSGSVFNGGTGTHYYITLQPTVASGANYTATSGITYVGTGYQAYAYWNNAAGSNFNANNGTFFFTTTANINYTIYMAAGQTLANLKVNASGRPNNYLYTTGNVTGTTTIYSGNLSTRVANQSWGNVIINGTNASLRTNNFSTNVSSLTMSAGFVNATNTTLRVSGNWTVTGGTFYNTNSTVQFNSGEVNYLTSNGLAFDNLNITNNTILYAQDAFNFTVLNVLNGSAYNVTVNSTKVSALTSTNVSFYP